MAATRAILGAGDDTIRPALMTTHGPADLEPVERLYAYLTQALERTRQEPFAEPVTVAEIYQELVPYRSVRTELGFSMNADYEHALLRLLAGDAGLAELDPVAAREQIQRELESTNPNVGMYREFSACEVWVRAPGAASIERPLLELEEELVETVDGDLVASVEGATATSQVAPARCAACAAAMPRRSGLRYCPYCGADQMGRTIRRCARCGDTIEPDWAFCIACGAPDVRPGASGGG